MPATVYVYLRHWSFITTFVYDFILRRRVMHGAKLALHSDDETTDPTEET
jgi:hypothetical protein